MSNSLTSRWRLVREALSEYFWDETRLLMFLVGLAVLAFGALYFFGVFTRAEPYAYYFFGRAQETLKGPGDPDDSYTQALGLKPAWGEAYYRRGLWRCKRGGPDAGLRDLEMAAEFLSAPSKAMRAHAEVSETLGRHDQAAWDLRQAVERNPKDGFNYLALAQWMMKQERFEEALDGFQSALRWDPELVDARIGVEEAKRAIEQEKLRRQMNGDN